ncbi:hypothetical protein EOD39_18726 [Acipenser ruthenus]|uniref:Uncharacterized protein n=1 Tax=Acipenser ruthenus TaxID=7906 RepID=A0A444V053_ACIRT|nr:hypothetical protein EOD39_18726 [Acipenser ruthenus]
MKTYPVEAFLPSNRDDDVTAIEVAGVACGSRHTFIWTQSGHAYSFGNNFYAQLGYDFRKVDFKEHQIHQGEEAVCFTNGNMAASMQNVQGAYSKKVK